MKNMSFFILSTYNILIGEVRNKLKWADGKLVKTEFDEQVSDNFCTLESQILCLRFRFVVQILALLGPKTEQDLNQRKDSKQEKKVNKNVD